MNDGVVARADLLNLIKSQVFQSNYDLWFDMSATIEKFDIVLSLNPELVSRAKLFASI